VPFQNNMTTEILFKQHDHGDVVVLIYLSKYCHLIPSHHFLDTCVPHVHFASYTMKIEKFEKTFLSGLGPPYPSR
jgi:hypothetical protein